MLSLRSKITQKVLEYFFLHETNTLYLNEMSRRLGVDRGNLTKKLQELEKDGILKSEWKGHQRYYSLNRAFSLLKEYKKIILKTVGFEQKLRKALQSVPGVKRAILFGSYASDSMDVSSDIDLLLVGNHSVFEAQKKISAFQKTIDREINVISMSEGEYQVRSKSDLLLKSIQRKPSIPIL